jgi:hypothetical protein
MCCGTVENSYKTLESVSFFLPSGTRINTSDPDAEQQFSQAEPDLAAGLMDIKQEIEKDENGLKWAPTQQGCEENGYPGMALDQMMEYPSLLKHA